MKKHMLIVSSLFISTFCTFAMRKRIRRHRDITIQLCKETYQGSRRFYCRKRLKTRDLIKKAVLPPSVYHFKAQTYLEEVANTKNIPAPLSRNSFEKFLNERVFNSEKNKKRELTFLDSSALMPYLINQLGNCHVAQAIYYFAYTTEELAAHSIRKAIGCYFSNDLAEFEKQYDQPLIQVSKEKYLKKYEETFQKTHFDLLLFETSKRLANASLHEIRSNPAILGKNVID